jgi:hypothetical protein
MKRAGIFILTCGMLSLLVFSCATTPKTPVGEGELRLLKITPVESGSLLVTVNHQITVDFEADGSPEVTRACFIWSGDGPYCYPVNDMNYGGHPRFEVSLKIRNGSNWVECYAEYMRNRKKERTNRVSTSITGIATILRPF